MTVPRYPGTRYLVAGGLVACSPIAGCWPLHLPANCWRVEDKAPLLKRSDGRKQAVGPNCSATQSFHGRSSQAAGAPGVTSLERAAGRIVHASSTPSQFGAEEATNTYSPAVHTAQKCMMPRSSKA